MSVSVTHMSCAISLSGKYPGCHCFAGRLPLKWKEGWREGEREEGKKEGRKERRKEERHSPVLSYCTLNQKGLKTSREKVILLAFFIGKLCSYLKRKFHEVDHLWVP